MTAAVEETIAPYDKDLRERFDVAHRERLRIEGPAGGFGDGYRIAEKVARFFPEWFLEWLKDSNWMSLCTIQGYDGFFAFAESMGYDKDAWWELVMPYAEKDPPCEPTLWCPHEELVEFIRSMKGGERVQEMGESGIKGEKGTVEIKDGSVNIKWDTDYDGGTMTTSFTGGARLIDE